MDFTEADKLLFPKKKRKSEGRDTLTSISCASIAIADGVLGQWRVVVFTIRTGVQKMRKWLVFSLCPGKYSLGPVSNHPIAAVEVIFSHNKKHRSPCTPVTITKEQRSHGGKWSHSFGLHPKSIQPVLPVNHLTRRFCWTETKPIG
jgi:hypothetical protein